MIGTFIFVAIIHRDFAAAQAYGVGAALADLLALPEHTAGRAEHPRVQDAAAVRAALGLPRRSQPAHVLRADRLVQVRPSPQSTATVPVVLCLSEAEVPSNLHSAQCH